MAEIALEYNESDLARLVLDYLEEEECPAAYKAFIRGSKHLNSRVSHQTSSFKCLRDIYAEYCTFRTYTRSGKIPTLHSQLLRCKSILNIAQLLFGYIKMLQSMLEQAQNSVMKINQSGWRRMCEACHTIDNVDGCECPTRPQMLPSQVTTPFKIEALPVESLVETTQLADLPGTSATTKRKFSTEIHPTLPLRARVSDVDPRVCRAEASETAAGSHLECDQQEARKGPPSAGAQSLNLSVKTMDLMNCSEDLSDILSMVNRNSAGTLTNAEDNLEVNRSSGNSSQDPTRRTLSMERSFHDFASGVGSAGESGNVVSEAMPDSSTPESINVQSAMPSDYKDDATKIPIKAIKSLNDHFLPNIANVSSHQQIHQYSNARAAQTFSGAVNSVYIGSRATNQSTCNSSSPNKIKILSNDKLSGDESKIFIAKATGHASVLKPLPCKPAGVTTFTTLPSQVIQINGVSAYQQTRPPGVAYTKDQIMAMPTVFVLQPPTTSHIATASTTQVTMSTATNTIVSCGLPVDSGYKSLEPISVDIPLPEQPVPSVQQFDRNGVMPKETVSMEKVCTPNKPLLLKKASSTPRRNSSSHVRVLDFNTPRRILTEEISQEESSDGQHCPQKCAISEEQVIPVHTEICTTEHNNIEKTQNEQETLSKKAKTGWDADLRALLPSPAPSVEKRANKPRTPKVKKKDSKTSTSTKKDSKGKVKSKKKTENAKKHKVVATPDKTAEIPVKSTTIKPTIHIKQSREDPKEVFPKEVKCIEISIPDIKTPETDIRPTIDKPPSAKQSLSDFFPGIQTPLKSMLDNIQMETPRFDPSVLGDPISDIKIGDIPTPNFFNTPNFGLSSIKSIGALGPGATPSSYSSRPTDYSSGGSYYRPDEQDYVPPLDYQPPPLPSPTPLHLPNKVQTPVKSKINAKTPRNQRTSESENPSSVSSRPRRRCTLKVSYYESTMLKNSKHVEIKSSSDINSDSSNFTVASSPSPVHSTEIAVNSKVKGAVDLNEATENTVKDIKKHKDETKLNLEKKRKRTVAGLKKKSPIKSAKKRRSSSSFPKLKIREANPQSAKRTKTVADLRRSVAPRRMPNESMEISKTKSTSKDQLECYTPAPVKPAPPRSRRKSSTPRKVDKFVAHNIDDSASADTITQKAEAEVVEDELPPLRVSSDDGSQDSRSRKITNTVEVENDEIHQIRAFIEKSSQSSEPTIKELVQRGFDLETAKSIERDLLDTPRRDVIESEEQVIVDVPGITEVESKLTVHIEQPSRVSTEPNPINPAIVEPKDINKGHTSASTSLEQSSLKNDSAFILVNDFCMSSESFNEESANYFTCQFDEQAVRKYYEKDVMDENYSFNVQFDDGIETGSIKVSLAKQETLFDMSPKLPCANNVPPESADESSDSSSSSSSSDSDEPSESETMETLNAIQSISNINPLYTPMKVDYNTSMQRQCIDIFDSTLNSLDTPLKPDTPYKSTGAFTPRGDVEMEESNPKGQECVKRKREKDSPVEETSCKKSRPDRRLLQHIDIDFVLTKIHGESDKT